MGEFEIAKSMADVLNKLQHYSSNTYDDHDHGHGCGSDQYRRRRISAKLGSEEQDFARLTGLTADLALSRARASNRDFKTVMAETEFKVSMELARILAGTIDPVLDGLRKVAVEEEEGGGEVCGVCQDEMEVGVEARAMACTHKFHAYCIVKWLKQKNACPLCRHRM